MEVDEVHHIATLYLIYFTLMVCFLMYSMCGVVTPIHICWSYGSLHTIWSCDSLHVRCVFFYVWLGSSLVQTGHHHSFRGPKKSALSVIQFVVSCRLTFRIFRFECDFICDVFSAVLRTYRSLHTPHIA